MVTSPNGTVKSTVLSHDEYNQCVPLKCPPNVWQELPILLSDFLLGQKSGSPKSFGGGKKSRSLRDQGVCERERKEEKRDVWWPKNLLLVSNAHQRRQSFEIDTWMDRKYVERKRFPLDCCSFLSPTLWSVLCYPELRHSSPKAKAWLHIPGQSSHPAWLITMFTSLTF